MAWAIVGTLDSTSVSRKSFEVSSISLRNSGSSSVERVQKSSPAIKPRISLARMVNLLLSALIPEGALQLNKFWHRLWAVLVM